MKKRDIAMIVVKNDCFRDDCINICDRCGEDSDEMIVYKCLCEKEKKLL